MKTGWETGALASISEVFTDGNWIESKDQATDGIRLVQTGNVGEGVFKERRDKARWIDEDTFARLNCFEVLPGDCLISRLPDPVGRACLIPDTGDKMITAVDCSIVRPDETKIDPRLLVYFTQSRVYLRDVDERCSGTTRRRISRENLGKVPIPLPPLEEQQRIVGVLDEAFEGLACARKNAEVNLQNARELFERQLAEYFLETPDDWIFRKLKQITSKIGSGATPKGGAGAYKTQGISLIRSLNIHDRWFKEDKLAFIDDQQADKLSNVVVDERDVLLNITGASIARCCVAPSKFLPARVNQHVSIIRPDRDILSPEFLALMLTSQPYKDRLLKTGEGNGSTRQALTKALIQSLEVAFPPEVAQQEEAVSVLETAEKKSKELTVAYQAKLQDVEDLRQSLLQKAFAGELT